MSWVLQWAFSCAAVVSTVLTLLLATGWAFGEGGSRARAGALGP